jgi:hypothetical protein
MPRFPLLCPGEARKRVVYEALRFPDCPQPDEGGSLSGGENHDGSALTESLAIIEYLEECYPEPPMIGRSALERARVRELRTDRRSWGSPACCEHHPRRELSPQTAAEPGGRCNLPQETSRSTPDFGRSPIGRTPVRRGRPSDDCRLHPGCGAPVRALWRGGDRSAISPLGCLGWALS